MLAVLALIASLLATASPAAGAEDGYAQADSDGVTRIDGGDDVRQAAIDTCRVVRPEADSATRVLVSRDDAFADALAGSALLNFDACILFTGGGPDATLDQRVRAEIDRVLGDGAEIGLLGGVNAVSEAVETHLAGAGYAVERYAGASRFETAVEIARRASIQQATAPFREVILVNGEDWADAVTAGAYAAVYGTPIVLTQDHTLHPATEEFLGGQNHDQTWVVGGESAIQSHVAAQTPNPVRVAGQNRMGTATAVAEQMWGDVATGEDLVITNLEHDMGWTLALAAAPLSVSLRAPQVGVRTTSVPPETQQYLDALPDLASATLMGGFDFIDLEVEQQVAATVQPPGATGPVTPFAYNDAGEALRYVTANGNDIEVMPGDVIYPPTWSPDGSQVAVVVGDGTQNVGDGGYTGELVVATLDSDGTLLSTTTAGPDEYGEPVQARDPVWSPDGQRIAFQQNHPDRSSGIATYDVDTGEVETLIIGRCQVSAQPWSPHGQELVGACSSDGTYELVHFDLAAGGAMTRLGDPGFEPAWSPDGTQLLYGRSSDEVVTQPIADGALQGPAEVLDPEFRWACLSWRDPDVVFACGVDGQSGQPTDGVFGVFTIDVTVGLSSRDRLVTPQWAIRGVTQSADGEIGMWANFPGGELFVLDPSGSEVFRHDDIAYGPAFRPTSAP